MCFITCLQFLTGHKAAFYRCRSDGELIGSIAAFAGSSLPSGWLLCDGSAVSRTTYSALFSAVETTYGTGDGSTTFNVPNLVDKFIEGAATAGTVKAAGLPNITGNTMLHGAGGGSLFYTATGVMYGDYGSDSQYRSQAELTIRSGAPSIGRILIDASRSSSIYGNSSTVQPPALTMRYAIYTGNVGKHCWLRQS